MRETFIYILQHQHYHDERTLKQTWHELFLINWPMGDVAMIEHYYFQTGCEIVFIWMPQTFINEMWTLVQVMIGAVGQPAITWANFDPKQYVAMRRY